jgi:hypothetical protein
MSLSIVSTGITVKAVKPQSPDMVSQYVRAVGLLQELFQQLADEGKISADQARCFDHSQKILVNFHAWIRNELEGNIKVELPWQDDAFAQAWALWKKFKKEKGFAYKSIGEQSALIHLTELSKGEMSVAIAILKQSRENGWSNLFELKAPKAITKNLVSEQQSDYKQQLMNRLGAGQL